VSPKGQCPFWNDNYSFESKEFEVTKRIVAVPLQAWIVPDGSRKLRFPDFMKTAQDGCKDVSLKRRPSYPRKCSWYSFLLEAIKHISSDNSKNNRIFEIIRSVRINCYILLRLLFPHVKHPSLQNDGLLNIPNHNTFFLTASYYTMPPLSGISSIYF